MLPPYDEAYVMLSADERKLIEKALRFYARRFNDAQALDDSEYAPTPEQAALIQRFAY